MPKMRRVVSSGRGASYSVRVEHPDPAHPDFMPSETLPGLGDALDSQAMALRR